MAKTPVKPLKTAGTRPTDKPLAKAAPKKTTGTRKTDAPRKMAGSLIGRGKK